MITGTLGKLEKLRAEVTPAVAGITRQPRLDPKARHVVYKKLGISSIDELSHGSKAVRSKSSSGRRMAQHIRRGLTDTHAMLLYQADDLTPRSRPFWPGPAE